MTSPSATKLGKMSTSLLHGRVNRHLAVVGAITVAWPMVATASAGVEHGTQTTRAIRVFAVSGSGKRVQHPPPGIAGDVVTGRDRLVNAVFQFGRPKGARVGIARYRTLFASRVRALVDVTARLPGGTIRAKGFADFRRASNVIRIIDGTGDFANAKGTAEERALANGKTLDVYRITTR